MATEPKNQASCLPVNLLYRSWEVITNPGRGAPGQPLASAVLWVGVAILLALAVSEVAAQGIPEPSLILYGSVFVGNTSQPLSAGQVTWQITNQTDSVSITSTIVAVNTQFFYVAFVPLETRVVGSQSFPASANSLGLPTVPTTCARTAMVGGTNAAVVFSSLGMSNVFTLGPGTRGLIERVDLAIGSTPAQTFAQWLAAWGLPANTDPNADPLGKGMTYYQQFIAGTDPLDKNSVFEFVDIKPTSQGLNLVWTSFSGRVYTLESSSTLNAGFTALRQHIAAIPPTNTYTDTTALSQGPKFYRLLVEQP